MTITGRNGETGRICPNVYCDAQVLRYKRVKLCTVALGLSCTAWREGFFLAAKSIVVRRWQAYLLAKWDEIGFGQITLDRYLVNPKLSCAKWFAHATGAEPCQKREKD